MTDVIIWERGCYWLKLPADAKIIVFRGLVNSLNGARGMPPKTWKEIQDSAKEPGQYDLDTSGGTAYAYMQVAEGKYRGRTVVKMKGQPWVLLGDDCNNI